MAAGGFVSRSFESMLKECTGKKFPGLQHAIRMYLEEAKNMKLSASVGNKNEESVLSGDGRSAETASGAHQVGPERNGSGPSKSNFDNPLNRSTTATANVGYTLEGSEVELVLIPLKLAFETKTLKILELALDCLHKLIAYDQLEGDPGIDGGKGSPLLTDMLNKVCCCVDNSSPDSTILQVLKVLLTAVSSAKFRVHGEPMLGVIRVCYNIALHSKNPINQATSKAMLTQMVNIIFRRMEANQVSPSSSSPDQSDAALTENSGLDVSASYHSDKEMTNEDPNVVKDISSFASLEELNNLAGRADIKGLEAALNKVVHFEDGKKITRELDLDNLSTGKRDALLVFHMLCKMGTIEDNDEVVKKSQILSLDLLQGLLDGVNESFTKDFDFIYSVKAYLSYTLLRVSISQSSAIFQYATGIFVVVVLRFREHLKGEIGILFPLIVLRPLDGSGFPMDKKLNIIRMLEKVCKDSQMLVDFYINYDCDPEAPNLFERLITTLTKAAQGAQNADPNSSAFSQASSIKDLSLQFIVNVLKLLIGWEKHNRRRTEMMGIKECAQEKQAVESEEKENREDVNSEIQKEKDKNPTLEAATFEFNRRPVQGIDYLISNKLVDGNPASVAKYLKTTPGLDKAMIGDYLGQLNGFPTAVMHAYVDSISFSDMKFGSAIGTFLKDFQLPGEAQKVDRIIEKFAERYCTDNPGLFKNPDTAYVLAYAVIMLNFDSHHHMVSPQMSKSDFIEMITMSGAQETIPADILAETYDCIVKEEIKMEENSASTEKHSRLKSAREDRVDLINILNLALPKRMSAIDVKYESEYIIKQMQQMILKQREKRGCFYTSQQTELARPMVEAVGWRLLATFSVVMEEGEHKSRFALCLEGFKAGVHITHVLRMDTMRCAFLTSLVRLTFLHAPKEIRGKNVEALQALLSLCESEPKALEDTWNAVLECVSRLEYIISTPAIVATITHGSNQLSRDVIINSLKELAGKPAEQVFVNSEKLPSPSIVEFFTALCCVSAEELKQTPPRVFSLQKLVEISYYNMARIRMVWAKIWSVLSDHFISAGSHLDEKIVMYTIDSLKQIGLKYLEHPELVNFTFQNDILRPFVVLVRSSRSPTIRSHIVDCVVQIINSKVRNLKSGWHSVFMIFTSAADDEQESIVERSFEHVEEVILEHFDQVARDYFLDCVNCLIKFSNNKSSQHISLKAIALLRICENRLAEGLIPSGTLKSIDVETETSLSLAQNYWFPMLVGLSDLTSDPRAEVSSSALELLFDLLNERGSKFSASFWEKIFDCVLFPIFDHIRHAGVNLIADGDEWLRESCIHSLRLLCDLFNTFYKAVHFMLSPLLSLLLDCAKKTDQTVVSISIGALGHLIEIGGQQFSEADWDLLLKSISDTSFTTQPLELLNDLGFENLKNQSVLVADSGVSTGVEEDISQFDGSNHGNVLQMEPPSILTDLKLNTAGEGVASSAEKAEESPESGNLQRSQTFGQRIMENLLVKSFTFKPKNQESEILAPPPPKLAENGVSDMKAEAESPLMRTVRGKCITQLLLLNAIDAIQKKYWSNLKELQKIAIMDILLSLLDFAASYNSYPNLRKRMHHICNERPPPNLLRQELAGTSIYLEILQKTTSEYLSNKQHSEFDVSHDTIFAEHSDSSEGLEGIAEKKLVSFCEQVLRDTSDLNISFGENSMDMHRVLVLRSPVVVKVLKGMSSMDHNIFKKHLREIYPLLTKLVCCDQMDIRAALGDLFRAQLKPLLP